jgi:hypothetical protein
MLGISGKKLADDGYRETKDTASATKSLTDSERMDQFQHQPRLTDCSSKNEIHSIIPLHKGKERINYSIICNIFNELKLYSFLFKGSDF